MYKARRVDTDALHDVRIEPNRLNLHASECGPAERVRSKILS